VTRSKAKTLSGKIRILIGILSLPSIMLAALIIYSISNGNAEDIGFFEVIYAIVGLFAAYIALSGKRFF